MCRQRGFSHMNIFSFISGLSFSKEGQLRMARFLCCLRLGALSSRCHISGDISIETDVGIQITVVNGVNVRIYGIKGLTGRPA